MSDLSSGVHEEFRSKRRHRHSGSVFLGACSTLIMLATFLAPTTTAGAGGLASTGSAATPLTGTVSGTLTVTGAPKGFAPALTAVGACKTGAFATCTTPQLSQASGNTYTFTLPVGTWHLQGFYVLVPYGGAFLGTPATVTVQTDKNTTVNLTVAYKKPGSVEGTLSVTKIPSGVTVSEKAVVACPSDAPNPNAVAAGLVCAETGGSSTYSITTLSPGTWILYPSYVTKFGLTIATKGTTVTVTSGTTKIVNLTTPYLPPTSGLVSGNAVVTSAPAGFNDQVGVLACKGSTVSLSCASLQEIPVSGTSYELPLAAGTWTLEMFYFLQPYGGLQLGPAKTVSVVAGKTVSLPLAVAYKTPGTAHGLVTVTSTPTKVSILSYSVLACPVGSPYNGNPFDPQCASETSGVSLSPVRRSNRCPPQDEQPDRCPPQDGRSATCTSRRPVEPGQLLTATPSWEMAPVPGLFDCFRLDGQHEGHTGDHHGQDDIDDESDSALPGTSRRVRLRHDQLAGRSHRWVAASSESRPVPRRHRPHRVPPARSSPCRSGQRATTSWRSQLGRGGSQSCTGI